MYKAQAGTIHLFVLSILFTEYSNADSNEIMYVILQNLEKLQFYRNTVVRRREKCCPPQTASLLSSWMVQTVLRPPLLLRYSLHPHLTWRHHHHHHHPPSSFRATRAPSSAGGAWLPWVIGYTMCHVSTFATWRSWDSSPTLFLIVEHWYKSNPNFRDIT